MVARLLLAALLGGAVVVAGPAGTARGDDEPAATPQHDEERRPVTDAAVDEAVVRGVRRLRDEQKRDGSFGSLPGETALALLALRHSKVPADDRACRRAASNLERSLPDGTVYGAAIGLVALLEQDPVLHRKKAEELLADVLTGQCTNGQWSYAYRPTKRKKAGDNSNTQFALLALASARAHGLDVPRDALERSRAFLVATQNEDGGWGYSEKERSRSYASMTAGGLMMVALAAEPEPSTSTQSALSRARTWLDAHFDPALNTGAQRAFGSKAKKRTDSFWRHYTLWSVERAGAAAAFERIGGRDWYRAGARRLLDTQRDDGGWHNPETLLRATCFALLFLGRSTRRAITPRDRPAPVITPSSTSERE